jgi:hypothetical protein
MNTLRKLLLLYQGLTPMCARTLAIVQRKSDHTCIHPATRLTPCTIKGPANIPHPNGFIPARRYQF